MINNGNNIGKFYGVLIVGFILMVIIGIIYNNRKMDDHIDIRYIDSITGVLIGIDPERGSAFGKLKDGRDIFIFDSDNFDYGPYSIERFIMVGDSIVKPLLSDTLYIYREKKRYYFILGKDIGKETP